ncbi:MAG: hypothetical protein U9N84_13255 [Actinomycetota bacterium]|nr:hypothetical protein [Actinomycetota bacterium]
MTPLHRLRHLSTRFFGVLATTPLGPAEQELVNKALTAEQSRLFWEQDPIDQRHAFDVFRRVEERLSGDGEAATAALLHDVGKRHSDVGAVGRSLATVLDAIHLPLPGDWRRYRDHEALGAADLEEIGAGELVVAFARGRAGRPESVDPDVWDTLVAADDA